MARVCSICSHPARTEIELALLNAESFREAANIIEQVSLEFEVSESDLKLHAILHSPVSTDLENRNPHSLARQLKVKEAEALAATVNEYLITMTAVGRRLRVYVNDSDTVHFEKLLTKSVTDLYLGTGAQIRETVKLMAEVNSILNEDQNPQKTGIMALANAINSSLNPAK